jgi:hypothetical protein
MCVCDREGEEGEKKRREKLFDLKIHFSRYFYMAVTCQRSRFYASLGCVIYYTRLHSEKGGQWEFVNYC